MEATIEVSGGADLGAQCRAALVAGISGLALPASGFATLLVLGSYEGNYVPGIGDPEPDFVTFYVENFSKIRLSSTLSVWTSVLLLVFFIALVRATGGGLALLKTISVALMAGFTAVTVAGLALFASPTLMLEMTDAKIADNLDAGVARTLILLPDTMSAVGGILLGFALLALAWMLWASDLIGRRFLAVTAGLMGFFGSINPVLGGGSPLIVIAVWAIPVAILALLSRAKLSPPDGNPSIA